MEGVGSRQSRTSSRYASNPSAPPVFNGPVRKWKKQWVSSQSNNQNNGNNRSTAQLLLCRWTPLSATASADEPRKRRFRYTPVVPIERGNMEARDMAGNEAGINTRNRPISGAVMLEKPSTGEEAQEPDEGQADSNKSPVEDSSFSEGKREMTPMTTS